MIVALLLAAAAAPAAKAPPMTAIDAELAFARDARRIGQWSAFRKWADNDAVMFTPQAVSNRSRIRRSRSFGVHRRASYRATAVRR